MNELIERLRHRQSAFMHFEDARAMKEAADAIEAMRDVVEAVVNLRVANFLVEHATGGMTIEAQVLEIALEKLDKLNE